MQGRSVAWLATQMNYERANVYNIFRRKSIDTELLRKLSVLLKYNFFFDLANDFENSDKEL